MDDKRPCIGGGLCIDQGKGQSQDGGPAWRLGDRCRLHTVSLFSPPPSEYGGPAVYRILSAAAARPQGLVAPGLWIHLPAPGTVGDQTLLTLFSCFDPSTVVLTPPCMIIQFVVNSFAACMA